MPEPGVTPLWAWARRNAHIKCGYVKQTMAEFFGTMCLCLFIVGAGLNNIILDEKGSLLTTVLGSVFGLMTTIFLFGGLSGAHINPAVSLGLTIAGELSWFKLPLFWFAQLLGGYIGSLLAYGMYKDHLYFYARTHSNTSLPSTFTSSDIPTYFPEWADSFSPMHTGIAIGSGFIDQIVTTALLMMAVFAYIDKRNMAVPKYLLPFFICLTVTGLTLAFTANAGAVFNPARDLCPRLAALTLGWKEEDVLQGIHDGSKVPWWTVGFFGPFIGAVVGAFFYIFVIGAHLNDVESIAVKTELNQENTGQGEWRNTVFIPRTGGGGPPPHSPPPNYVMSGGGGVHNPGYVRDIGSNNKIY